MKEPSSDGKAAPDLMEALMAATKGVPVVTAKKQAGKNGKVPVSATA